MDTGEQRDTAEELLERLAQALAREDDDILDVEGAALLLKTSPSTVRELARDRVIPSRRLGRGPRAPWRFSRSQLLLWVRGSSSSDRR